MSKQVARVGDAVTYSCVRGKEFISGNDGKIIQGSERSKVDGQRLARDGDRVICGRCGPGRIIASAKNKCDGKRIARIGDQVRIDAGGVARIIRGSTKTKSA